jgi:hypothetical protein
LATSATDKLLQRREQLDVDSYRRLLSPVKAHHLSPPSNQDLALWRPLLGERGSDGAFPFAANLPELAWVMRAALLSKPAYFRGLADNGVLPDSTLAAQGAFERGVLRQLGALAKTGTVSDAGGRPLVGHLLVAWPQEQPVFLAVFRQRGAAGAAVLQKAAPLLKQWQQTHPPRFANVRVRLLTSAPRGSWEAQADCPEWVVEQRRISVCGEFRLVSNVQNSRSERLVKGILYAVPASGATVLETDSETYTDAVLAAEAQTLTGSAREAMRAVIAWNGSHGNHRHADSGSLCDTTHCMVFLGQVPDDKPSHYSAVEPRLLNLLDQLAAKSGEHWLPFASGGDEHWQRQIAVQDLATAFHEAQILALHRERRKDGEVLVHALYPDNEEVIACEIFRNTLKLPSCPDALSYAPETTSWRFEGIGAGHGQGLAVARAQALAKAGRSAEEILQDAYGH